MSQAKSETMQTGFRNVAQRSVNADESFIDSVCEQFGKSREEAAGVLRTFAKIKAIKLDWVGGRWNLTHGAFWEQSVIDRAAAS